MDTENNVETPEVLAEPESPTVINLIVKNSCPYPARIVIHVAEDTGRSTFTVFRPFEKKELSVNLLTLRHLQNDPKVRLMRIQ